MDLTDDGMKSFFSSGINSGLDSAGGFGLKYWLLIILGVLVFVFIGVGYLVFKSLFG